MSQNDFTIANQGFPAFRADLNSALQALASNSSGTSAPSTTFSNMWWYDSANNIMYIRNEDNDAWIKFAELDQTNDKFVLSGTLQLDDGTVSAPALTFNSDTNMGIYRGGTDILKFVTAGTDAITIDASQRLGIGTGSPAQLLHLSSSDPRINIEDTDAGGIFQIRNTSGIGYVGTLGTHPMIFYTNGIERMRLESDGDISFYEDTGTTPKFFWDSSAERLGIGTVSPATPIHTYSTSSAINRFEVGSTSDSGIRVMNTAGDYSIYTAGGSLRFADNNDSEVMRFSSGNLLVGKTSTGLSVTGTQVQSDGRAMFTRDGNQVADFNRKTSDGDIVKFYKDGTTVGSIGNNTDFYIASQDGCGLRFTNGEVLPCSESGAIQNGSRDLGSSSGRFKDLYLSGGVVFGDAGGSGTSTSNKLDSYEEGTFTPGLIDSGGGLGANLTTQVGQYTKVGNLVTFALRINGDARTSTNNQVYITGLPFTFSPSSTVNRIQFEVNGINLGLDSGMYGIVGQLANADTSLTLLMQGTSIDNFRGHDLTPSYEIYVHGAYFTT